MRGTAYGRCTRDRQVLLLFDTSNSWYRQSVEKPMFTDYYEIMEISPNANSETIDRIFRYLASRYHPDNQDTGDLSRFTEIVDAHNTLKDPLKRVQYDLQHKEYSGSRWKLAEEASNTKGIEPGCSDPGPAAVDSLCQTPTRHQRARHRRSRA
jgi:DnaJ-class molecular chaperone